MKSIRKVAVLGSGVMGAQIAAHLANIGIPSYLLDIVPNELTPDEAKKGLTLEQKPVRNRFALTALDRLKKLKPSPITSEASLTLITPGNFEDDLAKIAEVDWVVEAVVENLAIKQELWAKVERHWKPGTIVSSNTSGISIAAMVQNNSAAFKKHFLGTHFFNPPRYMKLLEIIPTADTDPALVSFMEQFGAASLGKGTVIAHDVPNFIANRIGTYGMMVSLQVMAEMGLTPDEVDSITGPAMGRPKSATFRTTDVVGLDTFVHVAKNCQANVTEAWEKEAFQVPAYLEEMVKRGWLGQKSGQGFFKKEGKEILTLDLETFEYRPRKKLAAPSLEAGKSISDLKDRLKNLVYAPDKAGQFAWTVMKKVLIYSALKLGEVADDIVSIDQAMKWGFGWEMGPFETWDSIGVEKSVARMRKEGETIPAFVESLLAAGRNSFYAQEPTRTLYFSIKGDVAEAPDSDRIIRVDRLKAQGKVIKSNQGGTLYDMGDDVAFLHFHSPKQVLGTDFGRMVNFACEEVEKNYRGLVVGATAERFCIGANAMMMLMAAEDDEWDELDLEVRQFQNTLMRLKYLPRPVAVAPYNMTLGGGAEISMHADVTVAAAETYMGLVEAGIGLLPGGGGNKEMLIRALSGVSGGSGAIGGATSMASGTGIDVQPLVNKAFEAIAMAKVSTSAAEARALGFLRPTDRISVNQDYLLGDAKQAVLDLDHQGYVAPVQRPITVLGREGRAVLELGVYNLVQSHFVSQHDAKIAGKIAFVVTGGNLPAGTQVTEQYLLDIEREAFLSLLGEPKTQERIRYMLKNNKPLRN